MLFDWLGAPTAPKKKAGAKPKGKSSKDDGPPPLPPLSWAQGRGGLVAGLSVGGARPAPKAMVAICGTTARRSSLTEVEERVNPHEDRHLFSLALI